MLTVDAAIKQILFAISDGNVTGLRAIPIAEQTRDIIDGAFIKHYNGFGGYRSIEAIVSDAIKLCSRPVIIIEGVK